MQKLIFAVIAILFLLPATAQFNIRDAHIVMAPDTYLIFDNISFINQGKFSQTAGNVRFSGNTMQTISGNQSQFYSFEIDKPGNSELQLFANLDVAGEIIFSSGLINLNGRNIFLYSTAQLYGENESSRIIGPAGGYVQIVLPLNAPAGANPGQLGAIISSTSNLGNTTIRRGHNIQTVNGNASIQRYFDILPSNNANLNARLRFGYFNAELNGLSESTLELWKSSDLLNWTSQGFTTRNANLNYVEKTGIPSFSTWTLSNAVALRAASSQTNFTSTGKAFIKRIFPTVGVKNSFYLEVGNQPYQQMQLMVFDAQGREVWNKQLSYQSQWCPLPALEAGVYFVRILSTNADWQGKFVKE